MYEPEPSYIRDLTDDLALLRSHSRFAGHVTKPRTWSADQEGALTCEHHNGTFRGRHIGAAPSSHRPRPPSRRRGRPGAITARLRSGTDLAGFVSFSPRSPAPYRPYRYGRIACCGPA